MIDATPQGRLLMEMLNSAWALLRHGAAHSGDPFNRPVIGTGCGDGCHLRTVILRQVDETRRLLTCFSDIRSVKIGEIHDWAYTQWLFYHPRRKIQLRIGGPAVVHSDDGVAAACWQRVKGLSRLNYCADLPPGTPVERPSSGLPRRLTQDLPKLLAGDAGRANFAVIETFAEYIDWLRLKPSGNLRAQFRWVANNWQASWAVP